MDQRQTFKDSDQLFAVVSEIFQQQQQASLLVDRDGLERIEGLITAIHPQNNVNEVSIMLDNGPSVFIKEIVGINGVFRSDYSEC